MDEKLVRRRCGIRSWSAWKPRKETRSQSPLRSRDPVAGYVEVAESSRGARGSCGIGRGCCNNGEKLIGSVKMDGKCENGGETCGKMMGSPIPEPSKSRNQIAESSREIQSRGSWKSRNRSRMAGNCESDEDEKGKSFTYCARDQQQYGW
jgi:hypothetical protein